MIKTFTLLNAVALAAGASSDPSAAKNVYGAASVMLTMKKTGDSTGVSFVVYTSPDGVAVDTEPYQTFSISGAGAKQITRPLSVGPAYFVVKATNTDAANAAAATAIITPVYGPGAFR